MTTIFEAFIQAAILMTLQINQRIWVSATEVSLDKHTQTQKKSCVCSPHCYHCERQNVLAIVVGILFCSLDDEEKQ